MTLLAPSPAAPLANSSSTCRPQHILSTSNNNPTETNITMSFLPPTASSSPRQSISADTDTERGRLKRRRMSSHSPPRAPSPSRGHSRDSGSRHRHHHRKHHRADSSTSVTPPPANSVPKNRRRSDAEPDHTLRGRARNRSEESISEGEEVDGERDMERDVRKRDQPPSRGRDTGGGVDGDDEKGAIRRQRSLRNLYALGQGCAKVGKEKGKGVFRKDGEGRLAPPV